MKPDKEKCEGCSKQGTLDCEPRLRFRQTIWAFYNDHLHKHISLSRLDALTMKVFDDGFYPDLVKGLDMATMQENK